MTRNSKKGITPAVAVALLLVISVALVAAIGYAVTSITPSAKKAPQGVFDVDIMSTGAGMGGYFRIKQISGDLIPTSDLKIVIEAKGMTTVVLPNSDNTFYNPHGWPKEVDDEDPGTNVYIAVSINEEAAPTDIKVEAYDGTVWVTATATGTTLQKQVGSTQWTFRVFELPDNTATYTKVRITSSAGIVALFDYFGISLDSQDIFWAPFYEYTSPWKSEPPKLPADNPEICFGAYTFIPGVTAKALDVVGQWGWYPQLGGTDDIHAVISNWNSIKAGDVVKVIIIYTPTNQIIWQGSVIVG